MLKNEINMFFHCRLCFEQMPRGASMKDFARQECGWTERGFQVWCLRHNINIAHVDFNGGKVKLLQDDTNGRTQH